MTLILPWPPSVNHYWVRTRAGFALTEEAKAYKVAVALQCRALGMEPSTSDVALRIDAYRPAKRGDLDNTLKAILDSLKGFVYVDDAQVVEIHARRHDDKRNPRVEVEIEA